MGRHLPLPGPWPLHWPFVGGSWPCVDKGALESFTLAPTADKGALESFTLAPTTDKGALESFTLALFIWQGRKGFFGVASGYLFLGGKLVETHFSALKISTIALFLFSLAKAGCSIRNHVEQRL